MTRQKKSQSHLKDNWYLVLALAVLLGGGIAGALMAGGDEEPAAAAIQQAGNQIEVVTVDEKLPDEETTTKYAGPTREEKLRKDIENYEKRIADNPHADTVPADLSAIATVYGKLKDWDSAATVLEDLLLKYPDSPSARGAYFALANAYESEGNYSMARDVYKRMLDYFDPASVEYRLAQEKLKTI